jgi:hypothetical protein
MFSVIGFYCFIHSHSRIRLIYNKNEICLQGEDYMFSPFTLSISPMKRLFLINFEKDPDEIYIGFEPQWFDDTKYGTGLRVIAWRKDGFVDVYQQPSLTKEDSIDVAGKGLMDTIETSMENSRFIISETGVNVAFAFNDKTGRTVEVEIVERSIKPTKPFSLLAPVGSSSVNPSSLPVYLMFKFDFVRRKNTDVTIKINGNSHKADTFLFPINGSRVYFMRYSADTFLVDWCPSQSQALVPLKEKGRNLYESDGTLVECVDNQDNPAFIRISSSSNNHSFVAEFNPPFPEITSIDDHASFNGEFVLTSDDSIGAIKGNYEVNRRGETVDVMLHPGGGWKPRPSRLFLKILFNIAKIFRVWPKSYQWNAKIDLSETTKPFITSYWKRI